MIDPEPNLLPTRRRGVSIGVRINGGHDDCGNCRCPLWVGVPARLEPIRSFAAGPRSKMAEFPVLRVKRSYAGPTVE